MGDKEIADKNLQILQTMNQWMIVRREGGIGSYFEESGYKNVAIYGYSYLGERLLEELTDLGIQVCYIVDCNKSAFHPMIPVITPDEVMEPVDIMIVTAIYYFDEIKEKLRYRISCPIVSLDDLLFPKMDEVIQSYAQLGADAVLSYMLRNVNKNEIFYIDAGAFDPVIASVTNYLYEKGARGINLEPAEKYYQRLVEARPRDVNLQCAVGMQDKIIYLNEEERGSYFAPDAADKEMRPLKEENQQVICRTLTSICDEYVEEGQPIHILKIDVAGYEEEALMGMNLKKYRPWIIYIEFYNKREWIDYLKGLGYVWYGADAYNHYFVAEEIMRTGIIPVIKWNKLLEYVKKTCKIV